MSSDKQYHLYPRDSFGIILCKRDRDGIKTLMIRKRFTYAFHDFVVHNMKLSIPRLKMALELMTIDELLILNTLNFDTIWMHIWGNIFEKTNQYCKQRSRFNRLYLMDGGIMLNSLIMKTRPKGTLNWEWPKGRRKNKNECRLTTAMREFEEETEIDRSSYVIIPDKFINSSHYDENGVWYRTTYFIAMALCDIKINITIGKIISIGEISNIAWMSRNDINIIQTDEKIKRMIKPIHNIIKRNINGIASTKLVP